jgi:hypothetical protein
MKDSPMNEPVLEDQPTGEAQVKAVQRRLLWHILLTFGMIAGVVAAATLIAHWVQPIG